jgi:hypothetical protein
MDACGCAISMRSGDAVLVRSLCLSRLKVRLQGLADFTTDNCANGFLDLIGNVGIGRRLYAPWAICP